ncbi:MAG: hypothetical protein HYX24_03255 [Candidatus Aenigmarchaeota archaeon]|nr:hypothetical protein [Candidatus Aenigmarchaeota archaeon]
MTNENSIHPELVLLTAAGIIGSFLSVAVTKKIFATVISEQTFGYMIYIILLAIFMPRLIFLAYFYLFKATKTFRPAVYKNPRTVSEMQLRVTGIFISLLSTDIFTFFQSVTKIGFILSLILTVGVSMILFLVSWKLSPKIFRPF